MAQHDDLRDLLNKDYNLLSKQELLSHLQDIMELIQTSLLVVQEEYKHGEYDHNFKQTFKHVFKKIITMFLIQNKIFNSKKIS